MFNNFFKIYTLLSTSLFSLTVQAQHPHNIEEITITARPEGFQNYQHIVQPLSVLIGDELRAKAANTIGETLSQELGVTASSFGQGASRPIIRGLSGARVQILQDGIGSLDASTISVDHPVTAEPMLAQKIEILRGPATLLYGSGASGGVVNIVYNRIHETVPDKFKAMIHGRYDSVSDGGTFALSADGGIDSLGLHFDALRRDTANYDAADAEILNSDIETNALNFGLSIVTDRGFLGASFGRYSTAYGIPLNPDEPAEKPSINLNQHRIDIAGQLNNPFAGLKSIRFRSGYVDYEHTEFENPGVAGTRFKNDEWEGRLELRHKQLGRWNGTLGVQYRHREFAAIGDEAFVPNTKLDAIGLFILEDSDWDAWHFEFGARYDYQQAQPDSNSGLPETVHNTYTISVGALWSVSQAYKLGISATRSQRAAAIEELFANGPHLATGTFEQSNSSLTEETSNNIDLSLRKTNGNWSWTINLFANLIEDFIFQMELDEDGDGIADKVDEARQPGGELLLVAMRQQDALFYGLEAESRYQIIDNNRADLSLRLWGDWLRAKLNNGDNLPRISPARLGGSLEYNRNSWHADIDVIKVFKQHKTGRLETATAGYTLLNAGLSNKLTLGNYGVNLYIRATNLLNKDARRHNSFLKDRAPLPGRSITVGVIAEF